MRFLKLCFAFVLAAGWFAAPGVAQDSQWYFGTGIGAQQWRGPLNAKTGMGGEILLGRTFSQRGALVLTAGYASLPFQQSSFPNGLSPTLMSREANLVYVDVLFELHPFSRHAISPFVRFGGGMSNVQVGSISRQNYPAGILDAGLLVRLNRDLVVHFAGNYHHFAGQALQGFDTGKNPQGFFGVRTRLIIFSSPGESESEENWFTTIDSELSPFAEKSELEEAPGTTPAETLATDAEAQAEETVAGTFDTADEEYAAPAKQEKQIETDVAHAAPTEVEADPTKSAAVTEDAASESDPFSRFTRKLDLLEEEAAIEPPARESATNALLSDEPPFESYYPVAKPDKKSRSEARWVDEEEPEENASEAEEREDRLTKLDDEDFLSPETEIADSAEPSETFAPQPAEREPEINDPPASQAGSLDAHLHALQQRLEGNPEDQELGQMRALLDSLDGNTSKAAQEYAVGSDLALHEDRELVELRQRLDELSEGERYAQEPPRATAGLEEGNTSPAYEAFKDRLGLMEDQPKHVESEEWNQKSLKDQISSIDKELAQKDQDIAAIRTALVQSAANGTAFPMRPVVTSSSFAQGYEGALNNFYMQRYNEAIGKFLGLIEQYPSHTLASNCFYWLGEAQYGFGDYQGAIASFNRVLAFARSLKKDNALLMLGKTYMALQRPTEARAAFNRLSSEYPFSDAVAKAQELMKSL